LPEKITDLRRRAEQVGRDPRSIPVSIFGAKPDRATVDSLEGLGVERVIFMVPPGPRDAVLPKLDQYATLIA
jgi:hypothetical protein